MRGGVGVEPESFALCHYRRLSQDLSVMRLPVESWWGLRVVTEGRSGIQASGGKGFTKDFCSVAVVTRC